MFRELKNFLHFFENLKFRIICHFDLFVGNGASLILQFFIDKDDDDDDSDSDDDDDDDDNVDDDDVYGDEDDSLFPGIETVRPRKSES